MIEKNILEFIRQKRIVLVNTWFNDAKKITDADGKTWDEIYKKHPELKQKMQDIDDFDKYTEKFFGLKYDNDIHRYVELSQR